MLQTFSEEGLYHALLTGERAEEIRSVFGDFAYDDMCKITRELDQGPTEEIFGIFGESKGDVYILPGILGSELSLVRDGRRHEVWVNLAGMPFGAVRHLKYGQDDGDDIEATGALASTYLWLNLRLKASGYRSNYLPYDWRDPVPVSGDRLFKTLQAKHDRPVTLVCHSMGGLVARAIANLDEDRSVVERIITLGTPNLGSYSPFNVVRGENKMLGWLAGIDQTHTTEEISKSIIRHWPGLFEMLPRSGTRDVDLFDRDTWPKLPLPPTKALLRAAQSNQASLAPPDNRFTQVIGVGHSTIQSISISGGTVEAIRNRDGDGTVPRDLAEFGTPNQVYYVEGEHGKLPCLNHVIIGVIDILGGGHTEEWATSAPEYPAQESRARLGPIAENAPENAMEGLADFVGSPALGSKLTQGATTSQLTDSKDSNGLSFANTKNTDESNTDEKFEGYPKSLIESAADTYAQTKHKREMRERAVLEGGTMSADTDRRLRLYANRMLSMTKRVAATEAFEHPPFTPNMAAAMENIPHPDTSAVDLTESDSLSSLDMSTAQLEAVLGETEDFLSVFFLKRGPIAARSVGRIRKRDSDFGFGSGFLVAPGLLMTNHHVLHSPEAAKASIVQLDYEMDANSQALTPQNFRLLPEDCFITHRVLDFTIVAVEPVSNNGADLEAYLYLPLNGEEGKIRAYAPVNIIQHPEGRKKQVVFRESKLEAIPAEDDLSTHFNGSPRDSVLHYTGDTQGGSSGSPVLSDRWEVIGLHNSAVPERNENGHWKLKDGTYKRGRDVKPSDDVRWIANQGIRVSRIVNCLKEALAENKIPEAFIPKVQMIIDVGRKAAADGVLYRHHGGTINESGVSDHISRPENRSPGDGPKRRYHGRDISICFDVHISTQGTSVASRSTEQSTKNVQS